MTPLSDRLRVAVLRVAALLATVLSVQLLYILVVDVVAWQWLHQRAGAVTDAPWSPRAGVAVVLAVLAGLWLANRVRSGDTRLARFGTWNDREQPWRFDDPTLRVSLADPALGLWRHAGLIQRLRVLHASAALGAVAIASGLAGGAGSSESLGASRGSVALLVAGVAVAALAGVLVAWRSLGPRTEPPGFAAASRIVGLAGVVVGMSGLVFLQPVAVAGPLPSLRASATLTAVVFALLVMGVLLVAELVARSGNPRGPQRAAAAGPGLAMLGLVVIGAAGAGSELLAAEAIGDHACTATAASCLEVGVGALSLAVTYAGGIVALLAVAAVALAVAKARIRRHDAALPEGDRPLGALDMRALRVVLSAPARSFAWLLGLGFAGLVIAGALLARDPDIARRLGMNEPPAIVDITAWAVPMVLLAWVALLELRPVVRLVAAGGIVVAAAYVASPLDLGLPIVPTEPFEVLLALGLTGPVAAIAMKAWSGVRSADARRTLGIAWDLGLFWPRWFHPFTPPTYSDSAVLKFREQITSCLEDGPVLVSAHSQGTLIAVATLAITDDESARRTALVTYGSPVGRLYAEMFGAHVDAELLELVRGKLTTPSGRVRWRNLHRVSDPIGGPIVAADQAWLGDAATWAEVEMAGGVPLGHLSDPGRHGHSNYPSAPEYALATAELAGLLHT